MKKGFYAPITEIETRLSDQTVRAIWYPSFEEEVCIEDFNGVYKMWKVKDFLKKYKETTLKFKLKLQRVKDGQGNGIGGY